MSFVMSRRRVVIDNILEAGGTSHAILPNSDERDGNETGTSIYPQGQTHETVYDSSNDTTIQVWFLASRIPTPRQEADEGVVSIVMIVTKFVSVYIRPN